MAALALASAGSTPRRVGVIGGGIAGLSAARRLQSLGIEAVVFDTGKRGPGGRASSRLFAGAPADHAAQYISTSSPGETPFSAFVEEMVATGALQPWVCRLNSGAYPLCQRRPGAPPQAAAWWLMAIDTSDRSAAQTPREARRLLKGSPRTRLSSYTSMTVLAIYTNRWIGAVGVLGAGGLYTPSPDSAARRYVYTCTYVHPQSSMCGWRVG